MASNSGKKIRRITDLGTLIQTIFADLAGIIRSAESGLDWTPIGALNAAVRVGQNTPVLVYNADGSTQYVAFGDQSMSAPTTAANGIPILSGQKFVVNSGASAWIRSSSANVFGYKGDFGDLNLPQGS